MTGFFFGAPRCDNVLAQVVLSPQNKPLHAHCSSPNTNTNTTATTPTTTPTTTPSQRLVESGHSVLNPAFALHAIEIELDGTRDSTTGSRFLYGTADAVDGGGRGILLSDRFIFN